jgi:hypothetical protein
MARSLCLSLIVFAACVIPPTGGGYSTSPPPSSGPQYVQSAPGPAPTPAPDDDAPPQQECRSDYGTTVCGYHCVADYGVVRCASTPEGTCTAADGQVTCWDPTERRHDRDREDGDGDEPQSECKSAYGTTVCGYGCVADYGQVRCASHPGGTCAAAYGQITCTD